MRAPLAVLFTVLLPLPATGQTADSAVRHRPLFTWRDARALGVGLAASAAISPIDVRIARWAQASGVQGSNHRATFVRDLTKVNETTLTLAGVASYGIGRLTCGRATADIALHATEAIVITSVVSQLIRGPLGRSRPSVSNHTDQYDFHFMQGFSHFSYRAFPSLHAATAYAAGAALAAELRERHPGATWYGAPLLYAAASLPGLSRMYLDQHWASDVAMGGVAGVVVGTRVVRHAHGGVPARPENARWRLDFAPTERGALGIFVRRTF